MQERAVWLLSHNGSLFFLLIGANCSFLRQLLSVEANCLFFFKSKIQNYCYNEDHSHAVLCKDGLYKLREDVE